MHDGLALYIAFDCEDAEVLARCKDHDGQTFRDDCVELFFGAPAERLSDTACFEINALGTLADYYYRHTDWINYRFESGAVIVASALSAGDEDSGYRVEIKIPLASLAPLMSFFQVGHEKLPPGATAGNSLRANFARWDRSSPDAGKDRFSIWTHPGYSFPHPHRPEAYGWLVLAE